ncbi:hypothetical protein [Sphingobacterium sp. IITKGP-BTPF85]|uniref:hypothetical protein n=1 Tax=Sphingobacterium sp. IITKGP-BTPF85 TaxID=1338009 RepID=UPI00041E959B|nr:hypothetical protein [Sphingobacterium sp. IITKGP-BTPF85]
MNVSLPKLFQVFVLVDNKKKRFLLQQTEQGNLGFAMPETCPAGLLAIEKEIAAEVVANFTAYVL